MMNPLTDIKIDFLIQAVRFEGNQKFWTKNTLFWIIGLLLIWWLYKLSSSLEFEYNVAIVFSFLIVILIVILKLGSSKPVLD